MKLDEAETRIVEELSKDARLSMRELARRADVSTPTASKKVKKLEDVGIVKGYRSELDLSKLGVNRHVFMFDVRPSSLDDMGETLRSFEKVKQIYELGGARLLAFVFYKDMSELDDLLNDLRELEQLEGFEHWRVTDEVKKDLDIELDEKHDLDVGCYYCHKSIEGEPVKIKMDGREHYLCCDTCAREYKNRYDELKEKSP